MYSSSSLGPLLIPSVALGAEELAASLAGRRGAAFTGTTPLAPVTLGGGGAGATPREVAFEFAAGASSSVDNGQWGGGGGG